MTEEMICGFSPCAKAPIAGITPVKPSQYIDPGKCEALLHIGLFFDGTNNNIEIDKPNFGHSNVARLADAYPEDLPNDIYPIYIPGVGTPFPEIGEMGKSTLGSAFAFGCEARVFCHWLDRLLTGGKLAGVPIRLRFVGLMDTVTSAGFLEGVVNAVNNKTGGHAGWAEAKFLRLPASVKNCVHMVSMHELRKNFPLDEIGVDGELPPNHQQFAYPGTHSDVGGGYLPGELGISLGATAMESDALKLSQIPLNHMLECAVAAGVPINKTLAVADTGHDPFTIAPTLQQAYDDFLRISGTGRRPLRGWLQPYLNWRWQMRKNYASLGHVVKANGGDKALLLAANARFVRAAEGMRVRGDVDKSKDFLSLFKGRRGPELTDAKYRQEELSGLDPEALALLDLAQNAPPTPEVLARFFDGFVHDSLAGFAKDLVEPTGHWRYRKGFRGNNRATISQRESAGTNTDVRA